MYTSKFPSNSIYNSVQNTPPHKRRVYYINKLDGNLDVSLNCNKINYMG